MIPLLSFLAPVRLWLLLLIPCCSVFTCGWCSVNGTAASK